MTKMKTVKKRIKCFATFAVLALESFLFVSITPKSANAVNNKPLTDFDEMYEHFMSSTTTSNPSMPSTSAMPDLDEEVQDEINKYMVTQDQSYVNKFEEAKKELITHLQCSKWYSEKKKIEDNEIKFIVAQVYTQYLILNFCHRVFLLRIQPIDKDVVSAEDKASLYGPGIKLMLTYLVLYAGNYSKNLINPLVKAHVIGRKTGVRVKKCISQLTDMLDYGDPGKFLPDLAAMKNANDQDHDFKPDEAVELNETIQLLNKFFSELINECYLPPRPYTNPKQEYDHVKKILDFNVMMDGPVGKSKSRISAIVKEMVKITEPATGEDIAESF